MVCFNQKFCRALDHGLFIIHGVAKLANSFIAKFDDTI